MTVFQDNIGWVWVGVKFQHKSGIHPRLCDLRQDLYGINGTNNHPGVLLKSVVSEMGDDRPLNKDNCVGP